MKAIRSNLMLAFVGLLAGCFSVPKFEDGANIPKGHGVLVTAMHSNWKGYDTIALDNLEFLFKERGTTVGVHKLSMGKADELKVTALPTGKYDWMKLKLGDHYLYIEGEFEIAENTVTYIGDIYCDIDTSRGTSAKNLRIADNEGDTKAKLISSYPKLMTGIKYEKHVSSLRK